jgi:hypothetical protein
MDPLAQILTQEPLGPSMNVCVAGLLKRTLEAAGPFLEEGDAEGEEMEEAWDS